MKTIIVSILLAFAGMAYAYDFDVIDFSVSGENIDDVEAKIARGRFKGFIILYSPSGGVEAATIVRFERNEYEQGECTVTVTEYPSAIGAYSEKGVISSTLSISLDDASVACKALGRYLWRWDDFGNEKAIMTLKGAAIGTVDGTDAYSKSIRLKYNSKLTQAMHESANPQQLIEAAIAKKAKMPVTLAWDWFTP